MLISLAMLAGLIGISMPLAIVGNEFSTAWEARTVDLIGERLKKCMVERAKVDALVSPQSHHGMETDLAKAFMLFDRDGNGVVTYKEFRRVLTEELQLDLATSRLRKAWSLIDVDDTGELSFYEFAATFYSELDDDEVAAAIENAKAVSCAKNGFLPSALGRASSNDGASGMTAESGSDGGGVGGARLAAVEATLESMGKRQARLQQSVDEILKLLHAGSVSANEL